MRTTITIPFATAASGSRSRAGRLEPFLVADSVVIAVEVASSDRLVPAATIRTRNAAGYQQSVWTLDGELVRPVEVDSLEARAGGVARRLGAENLLKEVLDVDGWDLIDWRREVPTAVVSAACFDASGGYDRDYTLVRPNALKTIGNTHSEDGERRIEALSSMLLVVDGELWTRCPAPRLVVDEPEEGPYFASSSDVHYLAVMDMDRVGRQFFSLDRLDDALAYCAAAAGAPAIGAGRIPEIEIHDAAAIAFDDLVETARMVAAPTLSDLGRDLAWFSSDGMDDFVAARAAGSRLREAPSREDALLLFEAFSRIAADPGDTGGLFDAPGEGLMRRLGRFGLRATAFEADVVPDLTFGGPVP